MILVETCSAPCRIVRRAVEVAKEFYGAKLTIKKAGKDRYDIFIKNNTLPQLMKVRAFIKGYIFRWNDRGR